MVSDAILVPAADSEVDRFCLQRNTGMGWIRLKLGGIVWGARWDYGFMGQRYADRIGTGHLGRTFTDAVTVPYRTDVYLKSTKVYGIKTVCENNSSFSSHKTKLHLINLHSWSFPHLRYML